MKKPISKAKRLSKKDQLLGMLRRKNGASIAEMMKATGWQEHTVRGFLSATIRKKLGLNLCSDEATGSKRRYHVA
ncbi:DUF3489 domain-containing protein [Parvularcula flava]|uniref:DUF3489 domain-containing protein n=1 Tax=Aquisalinus luteolus TaxID=1566827 RepID=A0A8J3A3S8_9PROT|nr:DUF3489 domain-containing protein [Aquisalinus luteolus]NHK26375.1 DUF3489 domain-containing protein [Aquisalinus luteolus]GGH92145.1 hypothetical protein GCM10011355_00950 [Aquisalinus luteolus]